MGKMALFDPNDMDWRWQNEPAKKRYEFRRSFEELLAGKLRSKVGIYFCGPQGIAKSALGSYMLGKYSDDWEKAWLATDDDKKDIRRRDQKWFDDHGEYRFLKPFTWLSGTASPAGFYDRLFYTKEPREVLAMDDFESAEKNPEIRTYIQNITGDGKVSRDNIRTQALGTASLTWLGWVLWIENRQLYTPMLAHPLQMSMAGVQRPRLKRPFIEVFGGPMLDRFIPIEIPTNEVQLAEFVMRTAFVDSKTEDGLWKTLVDPVKLDKRRSGFGFQGSDDEAREILTDILDWYFERVDNIAVHSYRMLETVLEFRLNSPDNDEWIQRASVFLKPNT